MEIRLKGIECGVAHDRHPGQTFARVTFAVSGGWAGFEIPTLVPLTHEDSSGGTTQSYDESRILKIARAYVGTILSELSQIADGWYLSPQQLQFDNLPPGWHQPD